jgi:hypothetical protein
MLFSDYLCYVGKLISKALTFVWGVRVFNIKKNVDSHQSFNKLAVARLVGDVPCKMRTVPKIELQLNIFTLWRENNEQKL